MTQETKTKNLLVELFVEELPPKALKKLGEAFADLLSAHLVRNGFATPNLLRTSYASPRRLAVQLHDVAVESPPKNVSVKLMICSVAFAADGAPTAALEKSVRKNTGYKNFADVPPLELVREMEQGKEFLFHRTLAAGRPIARGLQEALDHAVETLPIPKVMQYQLADGWTSVKFVRPAHGLVALHGDAVVPVSALGLNAGRTTHGHRFEASVDPIELTSADHYAETLAEHGAVIASFDARRAETLRQLKAAAARQGLTPIDDAALLDEVTALVERPNVLVCRFEEEFLAVPPECLILTMKANQKYFPLLDAVGKLTNQFLIVSNVTPADPSRVIEGNERVVRPRLADAKFFFDQDRKKTLESRVAALDKVVYHGKLGTQGERTARVRAIAKAIGAKLGGAELAGQADRAAFLAKADLVTDMVGEFPELQGIMGGYYARYDGESEAVAIAIEDHYKPRFAGDELPRNQAGVAVALADKVETLVGLFGIGQVPTGDKDPFALRRHALGVIRMLVKRRLPLDLCELIRLGAAAFDSVDEDMKVVVTDHPSNRISAQSQELLADFVYERFAGNLREQNYSAQEVDSVLSMRPARLDDVAARLAAVRAFAALPEAASLAAANKRVGNILKKVEGEVTAHVDKTLLIEPAERGLLAGLVAYQLESGGLFERGNYTASLQALAALKTPVDAFFDTVMVNADDPALRANRLGLLATLHAAMNRVADLSKLAS